MEKREFVVMSGPEGRAQIRHAVMQHELIYTLDFLIQAGKVTITEYNSIKEMINSEDRRDLLIADVIIETKL